jgi:cytochrome b561
VTNRSWRRLHWASAAALAAIVPLGLCTGALDDEGARDAALRLHVLLGAPVVVGAALRARRSFRRPLPSASARRHRRLVERTLLVLLLLLGLSGTVALVTGGTALVPWALEAAGVERDAAAAVGHRWLGWLLLALLALHLAFALVDRAARLSAQVVDDAPTPGR